MQKIQEINYKANGQLIGSTSETGDGLNVFYPEAEIKASQIVGQKTASGKNAYSISFMVWKTNEGIIAEAEHITVPGLDIYDAVNKVIGKIAAINSIELETVTQ